ncbi:ATP-binding protein [Catenovulum maritimum]|uniref:histidine kinase n=1 Tax=Catenovulum maritimum TaxID=1513271 RepID=A0A0J8GRA9_9ALTE|nr:ATP-binding protein [Catenovulum maritimum]KMT65360.1 hypothetical protein XM47_10065 [Catenovulum maritimum]
MKIDRQFLINVNPLNSLFGRIFLGFWATVLILIGITILFTYQFNKLNKVQNPDKNNLTVLETLHSEFERMKKSNLVWQIKQLQRTTKAYKIILKDLNTGEFIHDRKLPEGLDLNDLNLLMLEPSPLKIRVNNYLIVGPKLVIRNNQAYQLVFVTKLSPRAGFFYALAQVPVWLQISICLFLTSISCWFIARTITRPILKLRKSTQIFALGNLSHRLEVDQYRNDELGYLANDFNIMAEKLESLIELHKRLLANVSHELRTPLTRLELSLAIALKKPTDCSLQLQRIEVELHKLDNMLSNVLKLARLESDAMSLDRSEFNLSNLILDICYSASIEAQDKSIKIQQQIETEIICYADVILINSAIENILRNAIKYTPPHSKIDVELSQSNEFFKVTILDSGNGLNEEELERIFLPFYRTETSRATGSDGTGLGLAIAQKAIQKHQGFITATNQQGSGLKVMITLPKSENTLAE